VVITLLGLVQRRLLHGKIFASQQNIPLTANNLQNDVVHFCGKDA
jgi:hypothetical protein